MEHKPFRAEVPLVICLTLGGQKYKLMSYCSLYFYFEYTTNILVKQLYV